MNKSTLLLFLFLASAASILAQNTSRPLNFRLPYEDYIRKYIAPKVEEWTKWDRYSESQSQYRERVSDENTKKMYALWRAEADSVYQEKYAATIRWKNFSLKGNYDPEHETVLLTSELFGDIPLHVPKGETARKVVEQAATLDFSAPAFTFWGGDSVELRKINVILPSTGQSFAYDSHARLQHVDAGDITPAVITLPPIEPKLPTVATVEIPENVDSVIPRTTHRNDDIYGVIIGNENYFYESTTRFSANDAQTFYEYCIHTLGIPAANLFLRKDATYGEMLNSLQFLKNAANAKSGNVRLIFYFSGHGMSDIKDNAMYLLPVDCSSTTLQAALKASALYRELSDMKAQSATVFLDACFSGTSSEGALAALVDGAGIKITPREDALFGNLVVFSATTEAEIAYPYEEKQHRMFTYFLLKKLQMSKGDVTYRDLAKYIIANVKSSAFDVNRKTQTPKVQMSFDIKDSWENWRLLK
jgi:hypothetical protein